MRFNAAFCCVSLTQFGKNNVYLIFVQKNYENLLKIAGRITCQDNF